LNWNIKYLRFACQMQTEVLKQLSSMGRLVVCAGNGAVTSPTNLYGFMTASYLCSQSIVTVVNFFIHPYSDRIRIVGWRSNNSSYLGKSYLYLAFEIWSTWSPSNNFGLLTAWMHEFGFTSSYDRHHHSYYYLDLLLNWQ